MAEKRFYWLRLKRDFFKRHDIRIIESLPNGKDYCLFYLKLLCESVDHEGNLRFSDQIPYSEEMLATITNTNVDIVRSAIKVFCQLRMMEILDDGTFFMAEVQKMIGSYADNDNANRQRRFRERQKQIALPERYECVTENNESKRIELEKESKSIETDKKDVFVSFAKDDSDLLQLLRDFAEMRRKKGKPMTDRAKQMLCNKLESFPETVRKEALQEAIFHSWSSVYYEPPKGEKAWSQPVEATETDRLLRLTRQMDE